MINMNDLFNERIRSLSRELALLQKPKWRWKDICDYYGCSSSTANEKRKKAIEIGGKVDYDSHAVSSRYVLDGTTPEEEIRKRAAELAELSKNGKQENER